MLNATDDGICSGAAHRRTLTSHRRRRESEEIRISPNHLRSYIDYQAIRHGGTVPAARAAPLVRESRGRRGWCPDRPSSGTAFRHSPHALDQLLRTGLVRQYLLQLLRADHEPHLPHPSAAAAACAAITVPRENIRVRALQHPRPTLDRHPVGGYCGGCRYAVGPDVSFSDAMAKLTHTN